MSELYKAIWEGEKDDDDCKRVWGIVKADGQAEASGGKMAGQGEANLCWHDNRISGGDVENGEILRKAGYKKIFGNTEGQICSCERFWKGCTNWNPVSLAGRKYLWSGDRIKYIQEPVANKISAYKIKKHLNCITGRYIISMNCIGIFMPI